MCTPAQFAIQEEILLLILFEALQTVTQSSGFENWILSCV